jgi:hypothetical protein
MTVFGVIVDRNDYSPQILTFLNSILDRRYPRLRLCHFETTKDLLCSAPRSELGKIYASVHRPTPVVCFDFNKKKVPLRAPFLSIGLITNYVNCDIPLDHRRWDYKLSR